MADYIISGNNANYKVRETYIECTGSTEVTSFYFANLTSFRNEFQKFQKLDYTIEDCHNLKAKICRRIALFKLRVASRKTKRSAAVVCKASKTQYMHIKTTYFFL